MSIMVELGSFCSYLELRRNVIKTKPNMNSVKTFQDFQRLKITLCRIMICSNSSVCDQNDIVFEL